MSNFLKTQPIPVILFTYNRPDLLKQVLKSLEVENIPKLYIYSDAPAYSKDLLAVNEVRQMIKAIDWCETAITERKNNLGLGTSVKTGVSEVLEKFDAAIIFEDDLICVPGTYNYMTTAISYYANNSKIMSVTGWTHPSITPSNIGETPYFDGKSECWVWGTWARAWKGMDIPAIDIMNQCATEGINIEKYGTDMPKMATEAKTRNLWAIGWWYMHLLKGGLCLRPPFSLVEHLGWDGRGTTTTPQMTQWLNPPLKNCPPIPQNWPEPVEHPDCARLWRRAIGDPE